MPILIYLPAANQAIGGIDEYTKLMLHMDGADDGIVFTDDSLSPKTVTPINAVTKTAIKKFGTAAGYFDGSDYLTTLDSDDWNFGSGDFTMDSWVNFSSVAGQQFIFNQRDDANHAHELNLNIGAFKWAAYNGGALWEFSRVVSLSIDTWYHVAAVRYGNSLRLYLDGQLLGNAHSFSGTSPNLSAPFEIGRWSGGGLYLNGYLDELRISKGIARWTTDFTPETGPYTE